MLTFSIYVKMQEEIITKPTEEILHTIVVRPELKLITRQKQVPVHLNVS